MASHLCLYLRYWWNSEFFVHQDNIWDFKMNVATYMKVKKWRWIIATSSRVWAKSGATYVNAPICKDNMVPKKLMCGDRENTLEQPTRGPVRRKLMMAINHWMKFLSVISLKYWQKHLWQNGFCMITVIDWLIDWLTDWLADWLIEYSLPATQHNGRWHLRNCSSITET